ncbi:low temperature requirement protein A [Aliifodinibius halophilus]|uniref:Low temperature requirement protein A n=2 Tax=Fodinibius halophilus TaxID=1736908 RepID=A0A6M1T7E0_9BACT|nr:low temperature requirement protein A [Fodinibius halophilus]
MTPRDPNESHRQASFLELFFDLCFVVAIAQAAVQLHHALAEAHIISGIISFSMVFFAIWWAWMNFTWFASAYDNDDIPFRLATFVQIIGALVLAAGVQRGFADQNFNIIFIGYLIMRMGLASLWVRAALHDPERKTTNYRYAFGISAAMIGWGTMFALNYWPVWGFAAMALIELVIPVWAESANKTTWHPDHIAERYGLLIIIVLGESVLAATNAVQIAIDEQGAGFEALVLIIAGGLLTIFSMWWLYFSRSADRFLSTKPLVSFGWGYGHYFIFAAAAIVGAGIGVNIDHVTAHTALSDPAAAATITVPAALFLLTLWIFHLRPHQIGWYHGALFTGNAIIILLVSFSPWPILLTGLITVITVIMNGVICRREEQQLAIQTDV